MGHSRSKTISVPDTKSSALVFSLSEPASVRSPSEDMFQQKLNIDYEVTFPNFLSSLWGVPGATTLINEIVVLWPKLLKNNPNRKGGLQRVLALEIYHTKHCMNDHVVDDKATARQLQYVCIVWQ